MAQHLASGPGPELPGQLSYRVVASLAAMGPPSRSGFYVSRTTTLLLAGLVAALLLALAVLASLYGRCASDPHAASPAPPARHHQEESPSTVQSNATVEPEHDPVPRTSRPPGPWDQMRLPPWLVPLHYDLELWPRLQPDDLSEAALRFTGRVNITVRCAEATARLLLHSSSLECEGAEVRGPLSPDSGEAARGGVQVTEVWFAPDKQYLVLELGEALQPGSLYRVQLSFSGAVNLDNREGIFLNVYEDQGERR